MNVSNDVSKFLSGDENLFATSEWAGMYRQGIVPIAIGNEAAAKAILNLFEYKKLGKTILINPPFAPNSGLSIAFNSPKRYSINSDVKRVMRTLAEYLNKNFAGAYVDIAFPPEIQDIQPFLQAGFKPEIGYTYRLDLAPNERELLSAFSSERRKNVRDAENSDLQVELNSNPDEVVALVKDTLQRSGLKYDCEILRRMINTDWTFTVSIRQKSELLATAVVAFDTNCAYYIAGGTVRNLSNNGAGAYALWMAIQESKRRNVPRFDFCGSSVPSIESFFRGFGGELIPFFRVKNNFMFFDLLKSTKEKISS